MALALSVAVVLDDGSLLRRLKLRLSARSMPLKVRAVPGWLSVGVAVLGCGSDCIAVCLSDSGKVW